MATTKALDKRQHLVDRSLLRLVTILLLLIGVCVAAASCYRVDATARVFRDTGSEKAVLRGYAKAGLVVVTA